MGHRASCVIRAVAGPFGVVALDQVAPLLFVAIVLVLSIKLIVRPAPTSTPALGQ